MSSQTARDCSISRPAAMCRHSVPGSYARAAEAKVIASAVLRDVQKVAGTVRLWAVTLRVSEYEICSELLCSLINFLQHRCDLEDH